MYFNKEGGFLMWDIKIYFFVVFVLSILWFGVLVGLLIEINCLFLDVLLFFFFYFSCCYVRNRVFCDMIKNFYFLIFF